MDGGGALYFPIRLRCAAVPDLLGSAGLEDALARALGRCFARAPSALPASAAVGGGVVLQPPGLTNGGLTGPDAANLLARVQRAIDTAARSQALPITTGPDQVTRRAAATPVLAEASERFDPARFDASSGTYLVPSYKNGKARIAVDLGRPAAQPDWDDVARRLRDPSLSTRAWAFYEIHDLVEQGEEQAVSTAVWAVRADDEDPTAQVLDSLRILASRNAKRFRELLRTLRDTYQSLVSTGFVREKTRVLISASSVASLQTQVAALHILGALQRVALAIPEGRAVATAWEAEARGLARTTALVGALTEARTELYRYLTSSSVWVRARALAGQLVQQIRKVTDGLLGYPAIALFTDRTGPEFIYALEMDLVENHRWILATREKVEEIDLMLEGYRSIYGDQINFMEEGKALLESRFRYLQYVADNPLPNTERIRSLRQDADQFYVDWFGRAADAKYAIGMVAYDKLAEAFNGLRRQTNPWGPPDKYDDRHTRTLNDLIDIEAAMREAREMAHGPARGPDYLARVSEVERSFPLLSIRVTLLHLWSAVHNLHYFIMDKSIGPGMSRMSAVVRSASVSGSGDARARWLSELEWMRSRIAERFDRFDYRTIQRDIESYLKLYQSIADQVSTEAKFAAYFKIAVVVAVTVVTAGWAAPAGASVITVTLVTLGTAAVITLATVGADIALGKPIDLADIGIDFGKNVLFFGFLHVLNQKLFAIALAYPGERLKRLAILFVGGGIGAPLPELLIERLRTGAFPDNIARSFAASGLLSMIVGAIAGPKLIKALETVDRAQADVQKLMRALADERERWLVELERAGAPGANPADLDAANRRGEAVYRSFEQLAEAMEKLPKPVLERLNLSREELADLRMRALHYANKIAELLHEPPPPGGKPLAAPTEIVPRGLVPAGDNTFEFNPNSAGLDPCKPFERFHDAGYEVTESGGVLHLTVPGETTPRYRLLPVRSDVLLPALAKLVTRRGTNVAKGLDIVRAQSAAPSLERTLAEIATSRPNIARVLLERIGRHVLATDAEALRGIAHFLEIGGKPETLAVALGEGNRFGARETIATLRKFGSLTPAELKGIDKIVELHGENGHGTDSIVGIGAHHSPAGPKYAAIDELALYTESGGLGRLIDHLASKDAGRRREAEDALSKARELLAKGATPKLLFERRTVDRIQALRVRDVSEDVALDAYLEALQASTEASLFGPPWDYARFPKGPRRNWIPKYPIDMPDSSGISPTYEGAGRGRIWRNRAAFELVARAQGKREYRPSSSDPISAMSDAELTVLRDTPTSSVRSPVDPITGRPWEIEHFHIQQRVGDWLVDAGFDPSTARRLSLAVHPSNLLEVSQVEHAFWDAAAAKWAHRADPSGRTWGQTWWADIRATRPLYYMSNDVLGEIVSRANANPAIKLNKAPELLRALRAEIVTRGVPLTIR